jgi:hypothetical protein
LRSLSCNLSNNRYGSYIYNKEEAWAAEGQQEEAEQEAEQRAA